MLKGRGVQFEILKITGIDFYSGFKKTSQGGGGGTIRNPKKKLLSYDSVVAVLFVGLVAVRSLM